MRTAHRRLAALLCAGALTITIGAASGCGDDSDDAGLTRDAFVAQANAICAAGNERIEALAAGLSGPPTGAAAQTLVAGVADDIERQIGEIDALEPPDELRADVDALLDEGRAGIAALREDPESLFGAESPLDEANATAARIGLTACAS